MGRTDQTLGGDQCAIAVYAGSDGLSTSRHLALKSVCQRARQRLGGGCGWDVHSSNAKLLNTACPVVLIVMLRDDDLRRTG